MNRLETRPPGSDGATLGSELRAAGERIDRGEAELLLAHLLGRDRSWLFAWPEQPLSREQCVGFRDLIERRAAGWPVAQLTGRRAFWSLELEVNADTLIPRPETELLVEWALELGNRGPCRALDLGTGSGAVALALASERPEWRIVALDASAAALQVARRNAGNAGLVNVDWLQSDWFSGLPVGSGFDLIVGNPPYVAARDPHLSRGDLRFEPRNALAAGIDGLEAIRRIVPRAPAFLEPGGWLLLEHGYTQGPAVRGLLDEAGYRQIATRRDLAGLERVSAACAPAK